MVEKITRRAEFLNVPGVQDKHALGVWLNCDGRGPQKLALLAGIESLAGRAELRAISARRIEDVHPVGIQDVDVAIRRTNGDALCKHEFAIGAGPAAALLAETVKKLSRRAENLDTADFGHNDIAASRIGRNTGQYIELSRVLTVRAEFGDEVSG